MLLLLCHRHARISSTNSSSTDSLRKVWTLPVLASDEEFMRRVSIDLTGRPPDVDQLLSFLADQSSNKQERLIDSLLNSDDFVDRWTFWLGELVRNTTASGNVSVPGRNALHQYFHDAMQNNVPFNTIASDLIRASGNSRNNGPVNFLVR